MTTTEPETMALDRVTGEIAVSASPPMRFAMTPEQARQWALAVRELKRSVLVDGTDYMVIPGTERNVRDEKTGRMVKEGTPTLLKPGAETLLLAAGFGFSTVQIEDEDSRTHQGVRYKTTVHRGHKDNVVAECEAYAGYDESRFYVSAEERGRIERAYAEKDGRALRPDRCVEYRAPWNSLLKMAQKRALVGATLNACAASGLFTQDVEDEAPAAESGRPRDRVSPDSDEGAAAAGWLDAKHRADAQADVRAALHKAVAEHAKDEDRGLTQATAAALFSSYQHPDGAEKPVRWRSLAEHRDFVAQSPVSAGLADAPGDAQAAGRGPEVQTPTTPAPTAAEGHRDASEGHAAPNTGRARDPEARPDRSTPYDKLDAALKDATPTTEEEPFGTPDDEARRARCVETSSRVNRMKAADVDAALAGHGVAPEGDIGRRRAELLKAEMDAWSEQTDRDGGRAEG